MVAESAPPALTWFRHRPTADRRPHAPRPLSGSARAAGAAALAGARRPWENGRAVRASRLSVTKSQLEVPHACVTAGHPLGARVGAEVLRRGGNAVDAAVATAFAMAVVEPFMSCLAGGGSMLIHRPRTGASVALDFNVEAPRRGARSDVRARAGPKRRPLPVAGGRGRRERARPPRGRGAGVGGRAGTALERWGTLDLRDAVAPAVRPRAAWRAGRLVPRRRHGDVRRRSSLASPKPRPPTSAGGGGRHGRPTSRAATACATPRSPAHSSASEKRGRASSTAGSWPRPSRRRSGAAAASWTERIWRATGCGRPNRSPGSYRGVTLLGMPGATGWRDGPRGAERPRVFRRGRRRTVQPRTAHLRAEATPRRVRGPTPLARGSGLGRGPRGTRLPGSRTPAPWPRGSDPMVVASRGTGSTRGDSRAAEPAARGQPGRPGHPPRARRASARRRCARSTATGRSSR